MPWTHHQAPAETASSWTPGVGKSSRPTPYTYPRKGNPRGAPGSPRQSPQPFPEPCAPGSRRTRGRRRDCPPFSRPPASPRRGGSKAPVSAEDRRSGRRPDTGARPRREDEGVSRLAGAHALTSPTGPSSGGRQRPPRTKRQRGSRRTPDQGSSCTQVRAGRHRCMSTHPAASVATAVSSSGEGAIQRSLTIAISSLEACRGRVASRSTSSSHGHVIEQTLCWGTPLANVSTRGSCPGGPSRAPGYTVGTCPGRSDRSPR